MHIYAINIPKNFIPTYLKWRSLRLLLKMVNQPNNNKKNQTGSDKRSVPGLKTVTAKQIADT